MKISLVVLFAIWVNVILAQTQFSYESEFLSGFKNEISGETINYYTIGSQAIDALLVRSLDAKDFIEFETEPVPNNNKSAELTFVMIASLQVNNDSHKFDVYLDGKKYFTFNNPRERSLNPLILEGIDGARMEFTDLEYDRFEDLTGFLYFHLPAKNFSAGKTVRVRIVGETASSRSWFMVFKHPCRSTMDFSRENVILNSPGDPKQSMRVKIFHMMPPAKASIRIGNTDTEVQLKRGFNSFSAGLEKIEGEKELPVEFRVNDELVGSTKYLFKPVTPITIYILPHSHTDIGYTNVQDEVERIQWENLEKGIALAEKTKDYPEGIRFKWNAEVLWATDSYLRKADPEKKQKFINAVKNGYLGIDGMYANILTGLCSPEEWIWISELMRKTANTLDTKIESAMISDIPGWSWSIVPMLANSGIKYLSLGINQFDRIGSIRKELGDKPFYWVSPSGKEKLLTWVHEQGYSAFHYVPKSGAADIPVIEQTIVDYVNKLADDKYPYDLVALRYTIGSDNGPPDQHLSDNVREWNKRYLSPKLVIATTSEFFSDFEKKFGDKLPEISGDITPYWEDGAASSAYETSLNRQAADKLTQAMHLFSQYKPGDYPADSLYEAWRNVILYDEHTWGSWNSISEPESEFTKQQWRIKQTFANNASKQAEEILQEALNSLSTIGTANALEVINSSSLTRTDIAKVPESFIKEIKTGLSLVDENGIAVPVQKLSDGSTVFLASEIPAWGSKKYFVDQAKGKMDVTPVSINENTLANEFFKLEMDPKQGTINKIMLNGLDKNLINPTDKLGLGSYLYVNGRKPDSPLTHNHVTVKIKEKGPLVSSWVMNFDAPGCNSLEQEVKVTAGINRVEINYIIDKQKVYTPEAVRIAFPFSIPEAAINIENAIGLYQPEAEQIKGSCKNFFTMNNYVDVSNSDYGISLISPDAPLVEIGSLTNDANAIGWIQTCAEGTSIYSFLMNNYWHTNFLATQEGISSYRYFLYPHKKFNPAESAAQAIFAEQPLVVVPVEKSSKSLEPVMRYNNENVFIVSMQPANNSKAAWVVLYNASANDTEIEPAFSKKPAGIYESDLIKNKQSAVTSPVSIPGKGIRCMFVEW